MDGEIGVKCKEGLQRPELCLAEMQTVTSKATMVMTFTLKGALFKPLPQEVVPRCYLLSFHSSFQIGTQPVGANTLIPS